MPTAEILFGLDGEPFTWLDGKPITKADADRIGEYRPDHDGYGIKRIVWSGDRVAIVDFLPPKGMFD